MTEEHKAVLLEINSLTNDEDTRQELWVQYLTTGSLCFIEKLEKIKFDSEQDYELAVLIMQLITSESSEVEAIQEAVCSLTDLERSIVACLLIHLDIEQISWYKELAPIRVMQVIATIRNNSKWKEVWRLREKLKE
jgi:hypothetical protein